MSKTWKRRKKWNDDELDSDSRKQWREAQRRLNKQKKNKARFGAEPEQEPELWNRPPRRY